MYLSSVFIFSLPFLPFSGFFDSKSGESVSKANEVKKELSAPERSSNKFISAGTQIGLWVWQPKYIQDPVERSSMLEFCESHGIGSLFIQVHFDKSDEGDYVLADRLEWAELLLEANSLGVRVEALDGSGEMAFNENRADTISRLQALLDYNLAQPNNARFSGIHYDIEPYTTYRWMSGDHKTVAVELLGVLSELRGIVNQRDSSLTFANDIPFWYDGDERFLVEFNGYTKYLNEHIQDISDYVGIMSYRTVMTGENSVTEISTGELAYGAKIGRPVYLGIETVELQDTPNITFFGRSAADVTSAVRELSEVHKSSPSFGGVFIHEYQTLRQIWQK